MRTFNALIDITQINTRICNGVMEKNNTLSALEVHLTQRGTTAKANVKNINANLSYERYRK